MMGNFKGTKGWKITDLGKDPDDIRIQLNDGSIDMWYGMEGWPTKEQAKANALLISKAPEMLEMLEKLADTMREFDGWRDEYNQIKQLIKSATEL